MVGHAAEVSAQGHMFVPVRPKPQTQGKGAALHGKGAEGVVGQSHRGPWAHVECSQMHV